MFPAGRDYIVPTNAKPITDSIASIYLIGIDEILRLLIDHRKDDGHPIIVILDCCRTENVSNKSPLGDVWAKVGAKSNIAILYSTAQGEEALDGYQGSNHSPFTSKYRTIWDYHRCGCGHTEWLSAA